MGMRCDEAEFKDQFAGRNVSQFTLNTSGGASSDEEINSVSGASVSSGAVVNAVNAALDFYAANVK
jgi:Na+-translocating ferredoxin:NAD+ oxidoreductase RnfG subunit